MTSLQSLKAYAITDLTPNEIKALIHELQTHQEELHAQNEELQAQQLELELQNDRLRQMHLDIENSRNNYAKLYDKYVQLFNHAPIGYISIDQEGLIHEANLTVADCLGVASRSLIGRPFKSFVANESKGTFNQHLSKAITSNSHQTCELQLRDFDGTLFDVQLNSDAIMDQENGYLDIRTAIIDITERKKNEAIISSSLEEKKALLRELYHRTKNNMQVISALLTIETYKTKDDRLMNILREIDHKIKSMALVHEMLYQSDSLARINLKDYIQKLSELLLISYKIRTQQGLIRFDLEDVYLSIDQSVPCGLILNEVISNSFKYAFPRKKVNYPFSRDKEICLLIRLPHLFVWCTLCGKEEAPWNIRQRSRRSHCQSFQRTC